MRRLAIALILAAAGATAAAEEPALKDEKAKNSYAVGVDTGYRLKGMAVELDPELVARGVRDALGDGTPLLSDEELKAVLAALRIELRTRHDQARTRLGEQNRKDGEAFLAENKTRQGVVTLASGLQYRVLTVGDGEKPTADDTVVCHYRASFIDGTEFDSSAKRKQPATFALKSVIKGWNEALQLMPVGSRWQLFVPSELAYGEAGTRGTVGPNATLVFEVELVSIQARTGAQRQPGESPQRQARAKGGSHTP